MALASLCQFVAVLTNDHQMMDETNLINGGEFKDIWTVPYVSRKHVKKALTPPLYGSSKNPKELWDANKLEYTQKQINEIMKDLAIGKFANARNFKDFIINGCKPQLKENIKIWNDEFYVKCNRFKWEETTRVNYPIYLSTGLIQTVVRDICRVPDLNQFKRYHVTLLIHNLDSQVCNHICEKIDWILPNHDSFTIHPNDASKVRSIYVNDMVKIYRQRKEILNTYFKCIGINSEYSEKDNTEIDQFSPYCLK